MPNINNIYNFAFQWSNIFNSETVELWRESKAYSRDKGNYSTITKIDDVEMSIQSLAESDLLKLPEGDREKEVKKVYTTYKILKNDIIIQDGIEYKIKKPPLPWKVLSQIHHYKGFAYRIENE